MRLNIKRLVMWFKHRNHPCYIGDGEFDHDLDCIDDSSEGDTSAYHWECRRCDDEDIDAGHPNDYYANDYDYDLPN